MKTQFFFLLLFSSQASALDSPMRFDVYLDEQRIGVHEVRVNQAQGQTQVNVTASFDVRFLFINAYRYRHTANEVWRQNCIARLTTSTNDNGTPLKVQAQAVDQAMTVKTADDTQTLSGCVRSFAYWNPALLNASRLLNTQTGQYETTRFQRLDNAPLRFNGKTWGQQRYLLSVDGKADIQLWYDNHKNWQALQTTIGNKTLRYVRTGGQS